MAKAFHELQYYDEEIWNKTAETIMHKQSIQNIHFFHDFLTVFS